MKILYDHQAFTYQNWGGVSKSFCELIGNRPEGMEYEISIVESDNHHLQDSHLVKQIKPMSWNLVSFRKKHSFIGREKIYNFLGSAGLLHTAEATNKRETIKKLKAGNFDVFHPTFFDSYFLPYLNGKPFVLTVHDLMPELFGWYKGDPQIANKPKLCGMASAIVAVSENTKKDLCRLYDVPESKVSVIYHGGPRYREFTEKTRLVDSPYFLYVGRRNGYKNWKRTVKDFARFQKKYPEVRLVCTGSEFDKIEKMLLCELRIDNAVKHIFVRDNQMASLYANAIAFIFPSLYEGFGMPILEAFACGCPALLNNKSCFPEIGGDAALYFDSQENDSNLQEMMEAVYVMDDLARAVLKEKGKRRLELFSWERSAKHLWDIYNNI